MNTPVRANWPFPAARQQPAETSLETSEREAVHIGNGIHRVPELEAAIASGNHSGDSEAEADAIHAAETAVKALERTVLAYQRAGFGSLALDPVQLALTEVEYSLREVRS